MWPRAWDEGNRNSRAMFKKRLLGRQTASATDLTEEW